jgi:hypothetical protein
MYPVYNFDLAKNQRGSKKDQTVDDACIHIIYSDLPTFHSSSGIGRCDGSLLTYATDLNLIRLVRRLAKQVNVQRLSWPWDLA